MEVFDKLVAWLEGRATEVLVSIGVGLALAQVMTGFIFDTVLDWALVGIIAFIAKRAKK